jgi:hypothetical protein
MAFGALPVFVFVLQVGGGRDLREHLASDPAVLSPWGKVSRGALLLFVFGIGG